MSSTLIRAHFLIVRLSAIGDIVMASGLPSSIKTIYPDAKITWIVESSYVDLVRHHPDVDNVIEWPKQQWTSLAKQGAYVELIKAILSFRKRLKQYNFTHAVDAQGLLKSALIAFFSSAKIRIGFISKEHSHYLLTSPVKKPLSDHIASEYRALAKYLGTPHYTLKIEMGSKAEANALCALSNAGITNDYLVFSPFTTRPQKHWPLKHWKELISLVRNKSAIPIIILGGPGDCSNAELLTHEHPKVFSLTGKLALAESSVLVKNCHALVGVDTGLTHMSIAYHRPTVALFGSTCPYLYTENSNAHVLYKRLPCAPCRRRPSCNNTFDCMSSLQPTDVVNTLRAYL